LKFTGGFGNINKLRNQMAQALNSERDAPEKSANQRDRSQENAQLG